MEGSTEVDTEWEQSTTEVPVLSQKASYNGKEVQYHIF